jgi:spermidine/putrescine transport system permease protein
MSTSIGWRLLKAFTVLVYAFLFAPIVVVVVLAFNSANVGTFPISGVSLKWFAKLWENEAIVGAFLNSLLLGVLTAVIGTAVSMLAAIALVRYTVRGRKAIGTLIVAPLLVPETVLAVGLLLLLRILDLPRTFGLLLAGHVLITLPFSAMVIQAHLASLGRTWEEAAASLGASPFAVLREVTLPLSLPAIVAALLFAFTISFDNLTASLFWRPSGVETVPTQVFAMLRDSVSPEINALGTVMILITLSVSLLAGVLRKFASATGGGRGRRPDPPTP